VKIIDASFIEVPKQRNTKDENNQIKKEKLPNHLMKIWTKESKKISMQDGIKKTI